MDILYRENKNIIDYNVEFDLLRFSLKDILKLKSNKNYQIIPISKQSYIDINGKLNIGFTLIVKNLN